MSLTEIALIFFVIIIFFGPEDLPQIARALGKMIRMFKSIKDEIFAELKNAIDVPGYTLGEDIAEIKNAIKIPGNALNDVLRYPEKTERLQDNPRLEEKTELLSMNSSDEQVCTLELTDYQKTNIQ